MLWNTATSTRFSIEVRMYSCTAGSDGVVLVGVDADGPDLGPGSVALHRWPPRIDQHRSPSGVVDDVGATVVHRQGDVTGLVRSVEAVEVGSGGDVLGDDLDVGVDCSSSGHEASLEPLDQTTDAANAADEPDGSGRRLEGGRGADQERSLLLGEHETGDVVAVGSRRIRR